MGVSGEPSPTMHPILCLIVLISAAAGAPRDKAKNTEIEHLINIQDPDGSLILIQMDQDDKRTVDEDLLDASFSPSGTNLEENVEDIKVPLPVDSLEHDKMEDQDNHYMDSMDSRENHGEENMDLLKSMEDTAKDSIDLLKIWRNTLKNLRNYWSMSIWRNTLKNLRNYWSMSIWRKILKNLWTCWSKAIWRKMLKNLWTCWSMEICRKMLKNLWNCWSMATWKKMLKNLWTCWSMEIWKKMLKNLAQIDQEMVYQILSTTSTRIQT